MKYKKEEYFAVIFLLGPNKRKNNIGDVVTVLALTL